MSLKTCLCNKSDTTITDTTNYKIITNTVPSNNTQRSQNKFKKNFTFDHIFIFPGKCVKIISKRTKKEDGISLIHGYTNTKLYFSIRIQTLRFTHFYAPAALKLMASQYVCVCVSEWSHLKTLKNLLMPSFYAYTRCIQIEGIK